MECKEKENLKDCSCTYPDCPRKGKCCDCIKYHWQMRELPACVFSAEAEKTYDRSIEKFIKDQKNLTKGLDRLIWKKEKCLEI